jgi:poly [ADP-ribose] polymerase
MKDKAKVLEHERALYSATLTQSNLAKDDNKFFIIQALQIGDPPNDDYYLYTRWGRVGVRGQVKYSDDVLSKQEVIRQYHAKSQEKVKRGGYKMIDVTYDQGCGDIDDEEINKYFEDSRLPWKVQELVRLIFDRKMMHSNMKEIGYDEKRSPLGLISKKCIDQGYIALNKIMQVLKD